LTGHRGTVWSVAFSPDGRRILSGSEDKTIRVWDAETDGGVVEPLKGHSGSVTSAVFSPDRPYIVSGSEGTMIRALTSRSKVRIFSALSNTGRALINFTIKTFSKISASFTDSSAMKDGWILGPGSELLFWVPPTLRAGLLWPRTKLYVGEAIATKLDLESFVHGDSWSLCRESQTSSILTT
jgi:WD40 repeat protein